MIYTYLNIFNQPKLGLTDDLGNLIDGIHYDIEQLEFPLLIECSWNLNLDYKLTINFENELSESQKETLDEIVLNNS